MTVSMDHLARRATEARYAYQDSLAALQELQREAKAGVTFEDLEPMEAALRDIGDEVEYLNARMVEAEEVVFWQLVLPLIPEEELEDF